MFKAKNILFLTHSYTNFQKNQIEIIAKHFNKVYVLVRYKPIAEISNYFPVFAAKNHTYKNQFDLTNKPDNVTVIAVPLWYLPLDFFYKHLGGYHLHIVQKIITKQAMKFDIIHAHFIWTSGYVGLKLHERYKVPFIVAGLGEDVYDYPFRNDFWRKLTINILSNADEIITHGKKNEESMEKLGIGKKINLINYGFLPDLFFYKHQSLCREKLNLPPNKKIVISIGFLGEVKGHRYLIDAINIVAQKQKDILCIIIGEGELHNKLEKQISKLGLDNYVMLLGRIASHKDLVEWLNASDLFVLPSLSEGFGVVQAEAIACGKPVVATRNGGSEVIITTDDVGYLCEKANPVDLAEKIEMALNRNWDKEKILRHAQNFTWEKAVEKILDIYKLYLQL